MSRRTKADEIGQQLAVRVATLTARQATAVDLVAAGQTDGEVADAVGVTRQTVNVWRHHHPAFVAAVNQRRDETWSATADRLRSLLPRAVDRLSDEIDTPDGWRVALALVKLAGVADGEHALRPSGPVEVDKFIDQRCRLASIGTYDQPSDWSRQQMIVTIAGRLAEVEPEPEIERLSGPPCGAVVDRVQSL